MSEILKQNNMVVPYDFKLPRKFSPKNFRELDAIHRNFCKKMSRNLTDYLKIPVSADFIGARLILSENLYFAIKSGFYASYAPCLSFKINSNENLSLIRMDYEASCRMIDAGLGGEGSYENNISDLGEIERAVFKKIVERITQSLEDAFSITKGAFFPSGQNPGRALRLPLTIRMKNSLSRLPASR